MPDRDSPEHVAADVRLLFESTGWRRARQQFDEVVLRALSECEDAAGAYDVAMLRKAALLYERIMGQLMSAKDTEAAREALREITRKRVA